MINRLHEIFQKSCWLVNLQLFFPLDTCGRFIFTHFRILFKELISLWILNNRLLWVNPASTSRYNDSNLQVETRIHIKHDIWVSLPSIEKDISQSKTSIRKENVGCEKKKIHYHKRKKKWMLKSAHTAK